MKTAWFPPGTKPVWIGYYETSACPKEYFVMEWFDGDRFCDHRGIQYSAKQNLYWRGLTEKAK